MNRRPRTEIPDGEILIIPDEARTYYQMERYAQQDRSSGISAGDHTAFYALPKYLDDYAHSAGLSVSERFLYMLLLDRHKLSKENGWLTKSNEIYCYFSINEIMDRLGCGNKKAVEMLKHLEAAGLIRKIRRGQGMPTILIVSDRLPSCVRRT